MIVRVLSIALVELQRLARTREALFWIFLGPLIFVTFFGIIFREAPPAPPRLTIVNQDDGDYVARAMAAVLERDGMVVEHASGAPRPGSLEIPFGTAAALAEAQPVRLTLHARRQESQAERNLRFLVQRTLVTIHLRANPADHPGGIDEPTLLARIAGDERLAIRLEELGVQRREVSAGFQRSVPAYLVMFVFLNLLVSGAGIAADRASGRMRRLFIAPVSRAEIVMGHLLGRMAVGWVQIAFLLGVGVVGFGIAWAEHTLDLVAFLALLAAAAAATGLMGGTLFRHPDQASAAAVWTVILLAPLGGLWWPLEVTPPAMQQLGRLVPTGWAMHGTESLLSFGASFGDVLPQAGALAALAVVSLTLAARRLRP
jgi:ABC-2 type transport system permease protein